MQLACRAALRTRSLAPSISALDLAISAMTVPDVNFNEVASKDEIVKYRVHKDISRMSFFLDQ